MINVFFKTKKQKLVEEDEFPSFKSEAPSSNPLFIRKKTKLQFSNSKIRSFLNKDILEVTFKRRRWPIISPMPWQKKEFRRMLCTSNWAFLNKNKSFFGFKPPKGIRPRSKSWYKRRKLVIVYDLILKDWRMISLDDYDIVNRFETNTKDSQDKFKKNFKNLLKRVGRNKLKKLFNK